MITLPRKRARWVMSFVLAACRSTGANEDAGPAPTASATASAVVAVVPSAAPVASTEPAPSVSASDAAKGELDEAFLERFVFRQVAVGLIAPAQRLTWILLRGPTRVRLRLLCQLGITPHGERGHRLNGTENDESVWGPPVLTVYAGSRAAQSYRLEAVAGSTGNDGCASPPPVVLASCRSGTVSVLAAGAVLEGQGRWRPAAAQRVGALLCDMRNEDGDTSKAPFKFSWPGWPLAFAARKGDSAGIEWAFENSDMVVQEGAYRFLPPPARP